MPFNIEVLRFIPPSAVNGRTIVLCTNSNPIRKIRSPQVAYLCGECNIPLLWGEPEYVRLFVYKCECGALSEV